MFKRFFPCEYFTSTYDINFRRYYRMGYRAVIFDIDNTLVEHDAPADERATKLIKDLMAMGYKVCFLSNNDEERVAMFNENLGGEYIYKAGKPLAKGYLQAIDKMGVEKKETLFVGDQIFTDIWGANNAGVRSVLVQPIAKHEELQIVLKRIPEKLVIKKYLKNHTLRYK